MKFLVFIVSVLFLSSVFFLKQFFWNRPKDWLVQVGKHYILKDDYNKLFDKFTFSKPNGIQDKKVRESFLEQMIDKQVLLEEAQRLDLDKDKEFLFLVESFWKKAMIQRLLLKKAKEISKNFALSEEQMEEYALQFDSKIYARVRILQKKEVGLKLMKKEDLSQSDQMYIEKDSGWNWFLYENVDVAYRGVLFAMGKNTSKLIYHYDMGWIFLEVDDRQKRIFKSNMQKQLVFINVLKEDFDVNLIKKWIAQLRKKQDVSINKEVLNQIEGLISHGKK